MTRLSNPLSALRTACLAATLTTTAPAFAAEPVQIPLAKGCKAGSELCEAYWNATYALERFRIAYLSSVEACGRIVACGTPGKPNITAVDQDALAIKMEYALASDCEKECMAKDPLKSATQCKLECLKTPPLVLKP